MSFDGESRALSSANMESGLPRRRRTVAESMPSATPPRAKSALLKGRAWVRRRAGTSSKKLSNSWALFMPVVFLQPPNGWRLSCGVELESSQTEFYSTARRTFSDTLDDGRRQLQVRVRRHGRTGRSGPNSVGGRT